MDFKVFSEIINKVQVFFLIIIIIFVAEQFLLHCGYLGVIEHQFCR